MIDWHTCTAVVRDLDRAGGAWVFRSTRVPVSALFENLADGATVHQFVDWFPRVTLEQARAVLDHTGRSSLVVASATEFQGRNGGTEIPPLIRNPREGWAADSQRIAQLGDDALVWPEFGNSTVNSQPT